MPHILIVDDDAVVRLHLAAVLRRNGYAVQLASSGKEALKQYESSKPVAVILDIIMPEMDGLETLQGIRKLDPEAKVMGISGMGVRFPKMCLEIGRRLGMDITLEKPFSDAVLLNAVAALLESNPAS